jgi:DNA polymerase, archaea type
MGTVRFSPVDVTYKIMNGKPVVELFGKAGNEQVCVAVEGFEPYFWVLGDGEIANERVVRVEEHKKKYLGKEVRARKVFVTIPGDVPAIREKFKALEADILFTRRFLIDNQITPLLTYEAEGEYAEGGYPVPLFKATRIATYSEDVPALKTLAVDIETHTQIGKDIVPEQDPIIMIALYGERMQKVLTWKHFDNSLDALEVVDSEAAMIERFAELVREHHPDVLTGYYSDGFDFPYLKARAEKYKISLNIGLDGSGIRTKKGALPVSEITGIAHIDVLRFVKRIFRTSMTSFKLNDVAQELLGEGKVDVDLGELFTAWNEQNGQLEKFAKYNLQDAALTHKLCLLLIPNIIELTKMIGVTPADVSRMSFSQLVEWYLIRQAATFNELVPNRPDYQEERQRRARSYEGGFVYEPTPGLYKDVAVFDFRSLYPTIISAHNISPDTIEHGADSEDGVITGIRFGKGKGFISSVIENVIERRMRIKKLAKESDDKMLQARDQALKTIANSIYGYYAFFGARWYDLDCAKAITAYGRHHVQQVITEAKTAGLSVLYGDTDSVFMALNGRTIEEVNQFVDGVNAQLPGIMELEFEALYTSGIFVATKGTETGAKKKYALLRSDGKMKIRGFETVRRNLSLIAKETQEKALRMILEGKKGEDVAAFVKEIVRKLRAGEIPLEKVVIRTQITRDVKSYENVPPHVAIAMRMQQKGQKVGAGTSVQYVVCVGKGPIRDRAKMPEEISDGAYDGEYYVTNQVVPSVARILEVAGYDAAELLAEHKQQTLGDFG